MTWKTGRSMRRRTEWSQGDTCPAVTRSGRPCGFYAGEGTGHPGWGHCAGHGGVWPRVEEAWRRAMELATELDVSPYEALLLSVRQAGGRAAWADLQLRDAVASHREAGGVTSNPSKEVKFWLEESRKERSLFVKAAQTAVQAGVAAALVQRMELEGAAVADAVTAALDALELTAEQRVAALGAAQERLLAIEPGP